MLGRIGKSSPQRGRRPKAGGGSPAEPASSPSVGFA
ncbi:MAG: peptidase, partial [Caulobacter sp.]|nr:peptidase [Caulobacter sp.]